VNKLKLGLFILLALMLVLTPLLGACAKEEAPAEVKTLRIGHIIAMTGPISPGLEVCTQGVEAAAEWINEEGGITVGGQQYLIEIVYGDNKSTPEGTIAAANRLIYEENIKFIVGPIVPWLTIAMAPVSEEAKVIRCLIDGTGTPAEMNPDTPYTFTSFFETTWMPPAYDYLVEAYPEVKKVAIVAPDEPGGQYWVEMSKKEAEAHGLEVVFSENYVIGTEDFYPLMTKMLATEPDAVDLGVGIPPWYAGIIKGARDLGFTGPLFSGSALHLRLLIELVGTDYANDIFACCLNGESTQLPPLVNEFRGRVLDKYAGVDFQEAHLGGWIALWCLVQAIEEAQSLDTTVVANTWENMESLETPFGPGTMGGLEALGINHVVMGPHPITKVENGELIDVGIITPRFPK